MLDFILVKRKLCFSIIVLFAVSSCLSACNMYIKHQPFNYPNSIWVCQEPYIRVTIGPNKETNAYLGGVLEEQEFQLLFGYGTDVDAIKAGTQMISDETILFQGDCVFAEDHFTIFLSKDNLWEGKYYKLCFERIE